MPTRVPPGKHTVVVRMKRAATVGGPANFLYDVEVENPNYGKPIADPGYITLRKQFPDEGVKFASVRRAANKNEAARCYPEENVVPARVWDNTMKAPNGHWNAGIDNYGTKPTEEVGTWPHFKASARNLIKFDLSGLNKDTEILGARLRLTLIHNGQGTKAGAKLACYGVRREWNEVRDQKNAYSCWYGPQYIHNRGGGRGVKWTKVGCDDPNTDRLAEASDTVDLKGFPAKLDPNSKDRRAPREKTRLISFDISDLVKKWQSGELANNGVVLAYSGGGGSQFCSSEFQDYPYRPTLVIAYKGGAPVAKFTQPRGEDLELARSEAKKTKKPLLVKFYSKQCSVCTIVDKSTFRDGTVNKLIANEYKTVRLQIERHAKLAQDWGVATVPAVVVLESDGETKKKLIETRALRSKSKFIAELKGK